VEEWLLGNDGPSAVAHHQDDEKRHDPRAPRADRLGDRDEHAERDDGRRRSELGDGVETVCREGRRMIVPPGCGASVEPVQVRVRPLQVAEQRETDAADDRHHQRQREREPRCSLGVEPHRQQAAKPRTRRHLLADLARGRERGGRRPCGDTRIPPGRKAR
jgi:hypothetical protein